MQGSEAICKSRYDAGAVVNQTLYDFGSGTESSKLQRCPASMVPGIDVNALLITPVLDMLNISIDDSLTEALGVANISHLRPILVSYGIEAANCLSSWIIFGEGYIARNVDFDLFLRNCQIFISYRLWTEATAIVNDI